MKKNKTKKYLWRFVIGVIVGAFLVWLFLPSADYYEYEAHSPEECAAGEDYDAEYGVCYFDFYCETDEECALVDEKYGQVLQDLAQEYIDTDRDHHVYGTDTEFLESQESEESNAERNPEEEITKDISTVQEIRSPYVSISTVDDIVALLLPPSYRAYISNIGEESDGPDGILAFVERSSEQGDTWFLGYDAVDTYDKQGKYKNINEFISTLIHEYAHILTLNHTQVEHVADGVQWIECERSYIIVDEGCAKPSSYITMFSNQFWSEELRDQAYQAAEENNSEDFAYDLFDRQPNHFVTEYAATNEAEDIAESFSLFVLQDKPTGNLVKDQKILFFYAYPELVSLRNHMRGGAAKILEAVRD